MSSAATPTTSTPSGPPADRPRSARGVLRVSSYDRVAGLLVALLILVGFTVALLFLYWFTMRVLNRKPALETEIIESLGTGDTGFGSDEEFQEPGLEELDDRLEPALEDILAAVTDVVSTQQADLDAFEGTAATAGHGQGDARSPGPGGDGSGNTIPPWLRWEVHFDATTMKEYARRLDYFGIELAALGGGLSRVDYTFNHSKTKPDSRTTEGGKSEKRLRMTWLDRAKQQTDRKLMDKAGISTRGRVVTQFYSHELRQKLLRLEVDKAGGRGLNEIRRTVFRVVAVGSGYEFYVAKQEFRN